MSNSYRIRTQVGVDKSIKLLLDQDFEQLEILSLKIMQSQIYTRQCSDYGVIVGRVTANNGFGIPNAKISVFIPLDKEDENNPIITDIYPYKTLNDTNDEGYRYNLLPYKPSYSEHTPTGTFFTREDVLIEPNLIQVFDKYYKYTARTNESGDYMIFGVPVGRQTIHVDVDLSDIGEFSLSPQDLIRMGLATEAQVSGTKFKSSENIAELPQIVTINRVIEVEPLWGQPEICNLGITRTDFDLTEESNITITPTSIFMGSIISSNDDSNQKRNCKPSLKQGKLCNLVTGPGEILAIRQTILQDINGRPLLETVDLESGGQVIDDNGAWLVDVPMNLDYVTTNEFGERVLSDDPKVGIPTKGRYRFKVKWNQSPSLSEPIKRGYFLIPNIREYTGNYKIKSYAFSLDWDDYGDPNDPDGLKMIEDAIKCEDKFYEMSYNKVYTISQLITQFRSGSFPNRFIGIKDILAEECESENVKFPTNDANFRMDIIYLLFTLMMYIFRPIIYYLLVISHILAFLLKYILGPILAIIVGIVMVLVALICNFINVIIRAINKVPNVDLDELDCPSIDDVKELVKKMLTLYKYFTYLNIPNITYPDCDICSCKEGESIPEPAVSPVDTNVDEVVQDSAINAILSPYQLFSEYKFPSTANYTYPETMATLFAGESTAYGTKEGLLPKLKTYGKDGDYYRLLFTNSLPIAERINLFNVKAKYFDSSTNNPYGGVNQIRVNFNAENPLSNPHTDNVIVISCEPSQLSFFKAGKLISFQNTSLSKDPNLTGGTINQFGNRNITGGVISDSSTFGPFGTGNNQYYSRNITVDYTKPDGTLGQTSYVITGKTKDFQQYLFATDIEYYQVITAMTMNNYQLNLPITRPLDNNLWDRYLNAKMQWVYLGDIRQVINQGEVANPSLNYSQKDVFNNFGKQVLVFLVRGVDPHSPRMNVSYDLSKLFGYDSFGQGPIVKGKYKLNIPIQGGFRNPEHIDFLSNNTATINNSQKLYYDTYFFKPADTGVSNYSGFSSDLPKYYSSLSNSSSSFSPVGEIKTVSNVFENNQTYGIRIKNNIYNNVNSFVYEPNDFYTKFPTNYPMAGYTIQIYRNYFPYNCTIFVPLNYGQYVGIKFTENNTPSKNRGYYNNEIVEGGSASRLDQSISVPWILDECNLVNQYWRYENPSVFGGTSPDKSTPSYYAPSYASNQTFNMTFNSGVSKRQIVMRSDRLPTSTKLKIVANNYYALQANLDFEAYVLNDDGTSVGGQGSSVGGNPTGGFNETDEPKPGPISTLYDTFTCQGMIPLSCYTYSGGLFQPKPPTDRCYTNEVDDDNSKILNKGCYVFITNILLSLPKDFKLLAEWTTRTQITFGACRNVWSHTFSNNWINGTLYAFSFKNDRFFNSQNQPYSLYCNKTLFLDQTTNNFYYRSTPYDISTDTFIGESAPSGTKGNIKNLLFPTTIMDLGPRNNYLQEIIMSDDYDGYIVNKLQTSTYGDVSEILNFLILSRLVNSKVIELLLGSGNAGILTYFNSRHSTLVDGDYSQLISIQSELGVNPFEVGSYTDPNSLYTNGFSEDVVIGIFFSSDTQTRDFISPKRTILNDSLPVNNNNCAFSYFNVFTQRVPFYQWDIKQNEDNSDSIFGSQTNDWYTDELSSGFLAEPYQKMDRTLDTYRYFKTTGGGGLSKYFKGYIYSVNYSGQITPLSNTVNNRTVTVGAPQHFYFGLKKGKTALDRFVRKWINTDTIVD